MSKRKLVGLALLLGAIGLFTSPCAWLAWWWIGDDIKAQFDGIPFESTAWKEDEGGSDRTVRQRMLEDLLGRHALVGKTRAEIDELLGVPVEKDLLATDDYIYYLGPARSSLRIASEWLLLRFENDRVVEARLQFD